jgi:hypothetical protein
MMSYEFERFYRQQREFERALQGIRPMIEAWNNFPKSVLESVTKLDLLRQQFTPPADCLASTSRILYGLAQRPTIECLGLLSNMSSPSVEALQRERIQLAELARSVATSAPDIQAVLQPMLDSLASTQALLGLERFNERWVEAALQPQLAFQEFATKHLSLAATATGVARQNRLSLLVSSGHLLDSITKGLNLAAIMRPAAEELWTGPISKANIYHTLDGELECLDFEQTAIDTDSAVEETRSAKIAAVGARLVEYVYNLNVESEREGQPPLFKPTTKALMACAVIPSRVAYDAALFAEVIDHLFFLLYEGSGSAKRLTGRCDEENDLRALWRLKHLRSGARHDLDHGADMNVKKKNLQVAEAYLALIGQVVPRSAVDWTSAQLALYRDLSDMLEAIWFREGGHADRRS